MGRLLVLILWGAILCLLWNLIFPSSRNRRAEGDDGVIDTMVQDPNCSTFIPRTGALRKRIGGREHYFCSRKCLKEYREKVKS